MGHVRNGRHLAIDNRPPANRTERKAEGTYDHQETFETREARPIPEPKPVVEPVNRDIKPPQPYHWRVRMHDAWRHGIVHD